MLKRTTAAYFEIIIPLEAVRFGWNLKVTPDVA